MSASHLLLLLVQIRSQQVSKACLYVRSVCTVLGIKMTLFPSSMWGAVFTACVNTHVHTHAHTYTHIYTHTHTRISAHKVHTSCQFTAQKASPTFQHRLRCFPPLVLHQCGEWFSLPVYDTWFRGDQFQRVWCKRTHASTKHSSS